MTYRGRMRNGTVIFDSPPPIPDGAAVEVVVEPSSAPRRGSAEAILAADLRWHGEISELEELLRQVQEMRDADIPEEEK